jgi:methylated-DNA-[protein]-cysteine S-methyltransferase
LDEVALTIELPFGPCGLRATERGLTEVRLGEVVEARDGAGTAVLEQARRELLAYCEGKLRDFAVPVDLEGRTEFQRRVLTACRRIGYGETLTYGELAWRAGYPRAARAVGQVMATNRLALVIPCHRVIGSGGKLTGYGYGLALKERLLALERGGEASGGA